MNRLKLLILGCCCCCLTGCAGAQKTDWAALATDAAPEFRVGKCGPELVWIKDIEVYSDVEVVGELKVRRKCSSEQ